jgi:DNA-binding MarR family transcriptional regulator
VSEVALWEEFDLAHRSVVRQLDRVLEREHDLSLHGFELLSALASATGTAKRLRMSDLAARLQLTPSGVTRLVERLEADGSVTRLRDDADRRVVHAQLTTRGAARVTAVAETYGVTVRALLSEYFSDGERHDLGHALGVPSTTR